MSGEQVRSMRTAVEKLLREEIKADTKPQNTSVLPRLRNFAPVAATKWRKKEQDSLIDLINLLQQKQTVNSRRFSALPNYYKQYFFLPNNVRAYTQQQPTAM